MLHLSFLLAFHKTNPGFMDYSESLSLRPLGEGPGLVPRSSESTHITHSRLQTVSGDPEVFSLENSQHHSLNFTVYWGLHEWTDTQCPCWTFVQKKPKLYFHMLRTAPVRALGEGLVYQVHTKWLISLINGWFCDWGLWITYWQSCVRWVEATEIARLHQVIGIK